MRLKIERFNFLNFLCRKKKSLKPFLKKHYSFKIKLSASKNENPSNLEIIEILNKDTTPETNVMRDSNVQELLKKVGYIDFKISLTFSEHDTKSEILNLKNVKDKNGAILLLNNQNSLYHRLCQAILQTEKQCLECKQIITTYDKHHIFPLHLENFGLIEKKELDYDYNIIRIPKEFHYFLHAIRAIEYNSSKDFFITHLHFAQLIKSVNENIYKNIDFSLIYREDQVNLKLFTDILENYSVFSPKSRIIDNSTQKGLEKSIISRQSDFINQLLKNNTNWTNSDVPSTQNRLHLIPAKKYTILSHLADELIDLIPQNKKPEKKKTNYSRFTRYFNFQVKKPPFEWKCQEIENERSKMETKKTQSSINSLITTTLRNDSENRRIRTHPRVLSMLDNGGYSWVNIENKNIKLDVSATRFQNVIEMVLELVKLQNQSTNISDPNLARLVGGIMMKTGKSAKYFNDCWDWVPDANLALMPGSSKQIKLPLNKIFEILTLYDNHTLFIDLHNQFRSLLVKHVHTINYLNNATIQIEISTFREFMDTRFKIDPNNLDFLKDSNSIYFQFCYYYNKLIILNNKNIITVNRKDKIWFTYSIMPDFMNNILPVNFQIYKTQLKNPSNCFFTSLGVCYVLKTLRFLEFGFQQDFKEILSIYPAIPFLKSFLESRSLSELPFNFGLKFHDYKNDRWSLIEQLIKNQITLILLFNNARTNTFQDFNFKIINVDDNNETLKKIRENFFHRELIWTNDTIKGGLYVTIPPYIITRVYDLVRILMAYNYPKEKQETNQWSNAELLQNYANYMRRYLTQTGNFNSPFDGWKLKNFE